MIAAFVSVVALLGLMVWWGITHPPPTTEQIYIDMVSRTAFMTTAQFAAITANVRRAETAFGEVDTALMGLRVVITDKVEPHGE